MSSQDDFWSVMKRSAGYHDHDIDTREAVTWTASDAAMAIWHRASCVIERPLPRGCAKV
jgi:hypothetical protein